jgi:hypothetical protein
MGFWSSSSGPTRIRSRDSAANLHRPEREEPEIQTAERREQRKMQSLGVGDRRVSLRASPCAVTARTSDTPAHPGEPRSVAFLGVALDKRLGLLRGPLCLIEIPALEV